MSEVERRRADAIASLGLLEQAGDAALTALVRLGSYVTGARAGAVHLFTEEAQHRVAAVGAPLGEHPREDSMCRLVVDDEQLARFADVAEQAVWRLELTRIGRDVSDAACRDPLTGAVNRLLLGDRLAHAFGRRLREGGEVLVVVVDVDDFKQVNDTLGHDVGDEVLVAIARRLTAATRPHDTVARLGGDEFVVVAEVPDLHAAAEVWTRVEEALTGTIHAGDSAAPVRVTVGAAFAQPGDDPRAAIARADREMYARKPGRMRSADGDAAA